MKLTFYELFKCHYFDKNDVIQDVSRIKLVFPFELQNQNKENAQIEKFFTSRSQRKLQS